MCTGQGSIFGKLLSTGPILTNATKNMGGFGKVVGWIEDPLDLAGTRTPEAPPPAPYPTNPAADAPVAADEAATAANARERRRAALRYGRASTVGAGSALAPSGGGKQLVGL